MYLYEDLLFSLYLLQLAKECESITEGKEIIFSPYQTIEYSVANSALNIQIDVDQNIDPKGHISKSYSKYKDVRRRLSIDADAQDVSVDITLPYRIYLEA